MGYKTLGTQARGQRDWEQFSVYGFNTGLNIKSTPQELADTDLSTATNFILRSDGGAEARKGYTQYGLQQASGTGYSGLIELRQNVINGTPQNPAVNTVVGQLGGQLVNVTTNTPIGSATALGTSNQPWIAMNMYDPDHYVQATSAPVVSSTFGGSMAVGTYLVSITLVNASGETTNSPDSSVNVGINGEIIIQPPATQPGLTAWNYYVSTVGGNQATETKQGSSSSFSLPVTLTSLISGTGRPGSNTAAAPSDVIIICNGSTGGPYIFDGYTIYTPSAYSAISGAGTVQVVNNVAWFGMIPSQPNLIQGTALGHPEGLGGGLPGYATFVMTSTVTGLSILGGGAQAFLVIGMNVGITLLYGVTPGNYFEQDVPSDDGNLSYRSMMSISGLCYFMGRKGWYKLDLSGTLNLVSNNVEPIFLTDSLDSVQYSTNYGMQGARSLYFAFTERNRIYLMYDNVGNGALNNQAVYDLITGGWTYGTTYNSMNCSCDLQGTGDALPPVILLGDQFNGLVYNWDQYATTSNPPPLQPTVTAIYSLADLGSADIAYTDTQGYGSAVTAFTVIDYNGAQGPTIASVEAGPTTAAVNQILVVTSPPASPSETSWSVFMSTLTGQETLQAANIPIGTQYPAFAGITTGGASPYTAANTVSDNGQPIFYDFKTKFFKMSQPGVPKRIMRVYPEIFIGQSFSVNAGCMADYGGGIFTTLLSPGTGSGGALWDSAVWDVSKWAGNTVRAFYGAPTTRCDYNLQGEAFAFQLTNTGMYPPWIIQGFTGSFAREAQV